MNIFIVGEDLKDPVEISCESGASVAKLAAVVAERLRRSATELLIFVENEDKPLGASAVLDDVLPADQCLHIHRCLHVAVAVTYNQKTIAGDFGPATTIGRLRDWAVHHTEFGFHESDAACLRLQLPDGTFPDERDHVGQFVHHPDCGVVFTLAEHRKPQG